MHYSFKNKLINIILCSSIITQNESIHYLIIVKDWFLLQQSSHILVTLILSNILFVSISLAMKLLLKLITTTIKKEEQNLIFMINDRICTCMLLKLWKCEKMIKAVKKCACVFFFWRKTVFFKYDIVVSLKEAALNHVLFFLRSRRGFVKL